MMYDCKTVGAIIEERLMNKLDTTPDQASDEQFYKATVMALNHILSEKRKRFTSHKRDSQSKQVYYLCIEYLLGRSLKNGIYNLGLEEAFTQALGQLGVKLEKLYDHEPDAGLGNGGLGRLAACYLDGMATCEIPAIGHSILYEFGIFKQKIEDGNQTELPDNWLPGGNVWLNPRREHIAEIRFGGHIEEFWDNKYHHSQLVDYTSVMAVPHDIYVSGYGSEGVSTLRVWKAECEMIDMEAFNRGDYLNAFRQNVMHEAISKFLYPNDNTTEGKILRLKQEYFLSSAAIQDILRRHLAVYGTLDNFAEKNAIQLNDTHPTLAIPEFMRLMLDVFGYRWEQAWDIACRTFAYTNHTIMNEALERWDVGIIQPLLPRVYQVLQEIDNRHRYFFREQYHLPAETIERMAVISSGQVQMANLCVYTAHSVNGVSALHSRLIREHLFQDYASISPSKFGSVTNGIAARRWLLQSNPALTSFLRELLGDGFQKDLSKLSELRRYREDASALDRLGVIKRENKLRLAGHLKETTGVTIDPDSLFDVQVKRLHEYKRQHLNALNILYLYYRLKEDPTMHFQPRTFIFGAKAAPGYFMAKQIIRFICRLGKMIDGDPAVRDKLKIVYLEDYNVTTSEWLMPASEISEQISLAGTEASGTGNMKLMLNGAITLGTLDGANVEIRDACGPDNIIIFGMTSEEVAALKPSYRPGLLLEQNSDLRRLVDHIPHNIMNEPFVELHSSLCYADPYMVLADFESYKQAQKRADNLYQDSRRWNAMSLENIAGAGIFSADRAVTDYARNIWGIGGNE